MKRKFKGKGIEKTEHNRLHLYLFLCRRKEMVLQMKERPEAEIVFFMQRILCV